MCPNRPFSHWDATWRARHRHTSLPHALSFTWQGHAAWPGHTLSHPRHLSPLTATHSSLSALNSTRRCAGGRPRPSSSPAHARPRTWTPGGWAWARGSVGRLPTACDRADRLAVPPWPILRSKRGRGPSEHRAQRGVGPRCHTCAGRGPRSTWGGLRARDACWGGGCAPCAASRASLILVCDDESTSEDVDGHDLALARGPAHLG